MLCISMCREHTNYYTWRVCCVTVHSICTSMYLSHIVCAHIHTHSPYKCPPGSYFYGSIGLCTSLYICGPPSSQIVPLPLKERFVIHISNYSTTSTTVLLRLMLPILGKIQIYIVTGEAINQAMHSQSTYKFCYSQ